MKQMIEPRALLNYIVEREIIFCAFNALVLE